MKILKWILIVYLGGWFGIWALQKLTRRDCIPIPGVTRRSAEVRIQTLSPNEALLGREAKVSYNLILSAEFPWFLPKRSSTHCRYDNLADIRGLNVSKAGDEDLRVACVGAGEGTLPCAGARWIFTCSPQGELRIQMK